MDGVDYHSAVGDALRIFHGLASFVEQFFADAFPPSTSWAGFRGHKALAFAGCLVDNSQSGDLLVMPGVVAENSRLDCVFGQPQSQSLRDRIGELRDRGGSAVWDQHAQPAMGQGHKVRAA